MVRFSILIMLFASSAAFADACPSGQVLHWYTQGTDTGYPACAASLDKLSKDSMYNTLVACAQTISGNAVANTAQDNIEAVPDQPGQTIRMSTDLVNPANGYHYDIGPRYLSSSACAPPPPPPPSACSGLTGKHVIVKYQKGASAPLYCDTDLNCEANSVLGLPEISMPGQPDGYTSGTYQYTGTACPQPNTDAPAPKPTIPNDASDCHSVGGAGLYGGTLDVCINGNGGSNTLINGTSHDFHPAPDNSCTKTPNGGVVCYTDFAHYGKTPPTPDQGSGKTDQPATPDNCVTATLNGTTTVACAYSSTTTSTSTNYGATACPPGGCSGGTTSGNTGGTTSGTTGGTTGGNTSGNGGGSGQTGTVSGKGFGDVPTASQSLSDFKDGVMGSELAQSITKIGDAIPDGGTCPTASFNVFERQFTIAAQCTLMDMYQGQIRLVMLVMFGIAAIILFFKA